jgi:ABC-type microcin C transport system permease subunit YejE
MFYLVRDRWWYTFGVVIIFGLIFYFFSTIISLVAGLIFGFSSVNFLTPSDPSKVFTKEYFLFMGLSAVVQQVFYLVVHVGVGVHYFSLREEKDGSGLEAQIDQMGQDSGPHGHIDEQY